MIIARQQLLPGYLYLRRLLAQPLQVNDAAVDVPFDVLVADIKDGQGLFQIEHAVIECFFYFYEDVAGRFVMQGVRFGNVLVGSLCDELDVFLVFADQRADIDTDDHVAFLPDDRHREVFEQAAIQVVDAVKEKVHQLTFRVG